MRSDAKGFPVSSFCIVSVFVILMPWITWAQESSVDLGNLSMEDLLNLEVTTAGKKEQKLSRTASAVYVITADDIARSGLTSVPEALRLAPGVEVAQVGSSTWAITIRGFNSQYSDKLLVLVDGRTVYSPTFSGVLWNSESVPLENVERIEVVRGPGAAVWGANAVNGVINIITWNANETQGGLVTATSGSHDQGLVDLRYGAELGKAAFRVNMQYADIGPLSTANGSSHDRWDMGRADFRGDWSGPGSNIFMMEGGLYQSAAKERIGVAVFTPPFSAEDDSPWLYSGGSILGRWKHVTAAGTESTTQAFYDRNHEGTNGLFGITGNTFDVDFQQQSHPLKRNDVVWGLGYRRFDEETSGSFKFSFAPNDVGTSQFSGFGQDEIMVVRNRLWFTIGSKFEHTPYTGNDAQPDARLLWAPRPRHSFWVAASRAVRTPSSYEERVRYLYGAFTDQNGSLNLIEVLGNAKVESEKFIVYEGGYRTQVTKHLAFDLTSFYNVERDLATATPGRPFLAYGTSGAFLVDPLYTSSLGVGHGEGVELTGRFVLTSHWNFSGSYSWLRLGNKLASSQVPSVEVFPPGNDPDHQFQLHSYLTLPHHFEVDTSAYRVDSIPLHDVPAFTRLDVHLAWSPLEKLQLSSGLQNLLAPRHAEFFNGEGIVLASEVRRSAYGKMTWRF